MMNIQKMIDDYESNRIHWISLYVNAEIVTYFESCGVEYIPKEIKKLIRNKNIITNIYRKQAYNLIMYGNFYIEFIDFMLKGKSFLDNINLFSLN